MLWIAALLASLLPVDELIAPDMDQGLLDQLAVRGVSEESIVLAKFAGHWLGFGPPLLIAAVPAAADLRLDANMLVRLELGLLIGRPGLAALSVFIAALTAGVRGARGPRRSIDAAAGDSLLIFGAGSLDPYGGSALKLLAATSLLAIAMTPFAAGAAIRAAPRMIAGPAREDCSRQDQSSRLLADAQFSTFGPSRRDPRNAGASGSAVSAAMRDGVDHRGRRSCVRPAAISDEVWQAFFKHQLSLGPRPNLGGSVIPWYRSLIYIYI